jgi:hypothetical protein
MELESCKASIIQSNWTEWYRRIKWKYWGCHGIVMSDAIAVVADVESFHAQSATAEHEVMANENQKHVRYV